MPYYHVDISSGRNNENHTHFFNNVKVDMYGVESDSTGHNRSLIVKTGMTKDEVLRQAGRKPDGSSFSYDITVTKIDRRSLKARFTYLIPFMQQYYKDFLDL